MLVLGFTTNNPTVVTLVDRALRSEHPEFSIKNQSITGLILDTMTKICPEAHPEVHYKNSSLVFPAEVGLLRKSNWWMDSLLHTGADILLIPDVILFREMGYLHDRGVFLLSDIRHDNLTDYVIKQDFNYVDAITLVKETIDALSATL